MVAQDGRTGRRPIATETGRTGATGTQSDDAGDAPKTAHSGTRGSRTHLKHSGIHLLAIGKRAIRQGVFLYNLRDGILDAQPVFARAVY